MNTIKNFIYPLFITFFLIANSTDSTAQQVPIFSLYQENGYILNPAITGYTGLGIAAVSYRHQWTTEVQESPRTLSAGYRMPIYRRGDYFQKAENFLGVGAYLMHDKTGPTSYLSANLAFAYHISFEKINPFSWAAFLRKSHLSFGLAFSLNQYRLDGTELIPELSNDQLVLTADDSRVLPNTGLGVYYYYDNFYFGFSSPQIIPLKLNYEDVEASGAIRKINHYFIVTGGKIPLGGRVPRGHYHKFYIEPMLWFKKVRGAPYQYDAYVRFRHRNLVWFGAGYRSSKTIVVDAGVVIKKQFKLGYVYDISISDLNSYIGGSHEFIVAYQLDIGNKYKR